MYRKLLKSAKKKDWQHRVENIQDSSSPVIIWDAYKKLFPRRHHPVNNIYHPSNPHPTSTKESLQNFAQHFADISCRTPLSGVHDTAVEFRVNQLLNETAHIQCDDVFLFDDVKQFCTNCRLTTSSGSDNIQSLFVRSCWR